MGKNIDSIIIATRIDDLTKEETKEELKALMLELIEGVEHRVGKCERLKALVTEVEKL